MTFDVNELETNFSETESEIKKSKIERIIKGYRNSWDIIAELVQNSVDAIFDAKEQVYSDDDSWEGKLEISIDSENKIIEVSDNGIGIPEDEISASLVLGKSQKRSAGRRYGFMGYGLTFVGFLSSDISITSVCAGQRGQRAYKDLYLYVLDENIELPNPRHSDNSETKQDPGTTVTVTFPDDYRHEISYYEMVASFFEMTKSPELMEMVLRRFTAVGNMEKIFPNKDPICDIKVTYIIDGKEASTDFKYLDIDEILLGREEVQAADIPSLEDFEEQVKITEGQKDMEKKRRVQGIVHRRESVQIGEINEIYVNVSIVITSKHHLNEYLEEIQGDGSERLIDVSINNGILLGLDGMPSGIRLDNWTHSSYAPVFVSVDAYALKDDLDPGRKGITYHRRQQIISEIEDILKNKTNLWLYRRYVVGRLGRGIDLELDDAKAEMRRKVESSKSRHEKVRLSQKLYPIIEEQEVISLFFEMIGRGMLKGYYLKYLSGYQIYDGLFEYLINRSDDVLYNADTRPFGISSRVFEERSELFNEILIEFKSYLENINDDISDNKK